MSAPPVYHVMNSGELWKEIPGDFVFIAAFPSAEAAAAEAWRLLGEELVTNIVETAGAQPGHRMIRPAVGAQTA